MSVEAKALSPIRTMLTKKTPKSKRGVFINRMRDIIGPVACASDPESMSERELALHFFHQGRPELMLKYIESESSNFIDPVKFLDKRGREKQVSFIGSLLRAPAETPALVHIIERILGKDSRSAKAVLEIEKTSLMELAARHNRSVVLSLVSHGYKFSLNDVNLLCSEYHKHREFYTLVMHRISTCAFDHKKRLQDEFDMESENDIDIIAHIVAEALMDPGVFAGFEWIFYVYNTCIRFGDEISFAKKVLIYIASREKIPSINWCTIRECTGLMRSEEDAVRMVLIALGFGVYPYFSEYVQTSVDFTPEEVRALKEKRSQFESDRAWITHVIDSEGKV